MSRKRVWNFLFFGVLIILAIFRVVGSGIRVYDNYSGRTQLREERKKQREKEILDITPYVMTLEEAEENAKQRLKDIINEDKKAQSVLYLEYTILDTFKSIQKEKYGLHKLKQDSALFVNFKTQIKIPKQYYIKTNNIDSLMVSCKSPDNLNIFVHNFKTKDNFEKSFRDLNKKYDLKKCDLEDNAEENQSISYEISRNKKDFKGFAFCFRGNQQGLITFFEFESNTLSKKELKNISMTFLSKNLKQEESN